MNDLKYQKKNLMTEGPIFSRILLFALPLLAGNLFQQLYSNVDAVILGHFAGSNALAGIGAGASVFNTVISFSTGIASGAGVLIARFYGTGETDKIKKAVHTSLVIALVLGITISISGILCTPKLYSLIKVPTSVYDDAVQYTRLYFVGIFFMVFYSMCSGILNAAGNSKLSLLFLSVSSVVNVILDLLFVVRLHMGVSGAALATDLSQLLSCALIFGYLLHCRELYHVSFRELKTDRRVLRTILLLSIPAGLQSAIMEFSNIPIQAGINTFDAAAVAGFTAYLRIDGFVWLPTVSIATAAATFTAQNTGNTKRIRRGILITCGMGLFLSALSGGFILFNRQALISVFTTDPMTVYYGSVCAFFWSSFYWALISYEVLLGVLRGFGHTFATMVISLISTFFLRIIYMTVLMRSSPSFSDIITVYPISWILGLSLALLCFWELRHHVTSADSSLHR